MPMVKYILAQASEAMFGLIYISNRY